MSPTTKRAEPVSLVARDKGVEERTTRVQRRRIDGRVAVFAAEG